jgi:bifunctional non-homologous end joining protein LigD
MIPEGQYGAGTVMIWDKGTYQSGDGIPPDEQLARGKITVVLHGTKLCGGFTLVQTGKRLAVPSQGKRWLLIKHRDEYVDASWDIESSKLDRSVLTGRTLQEIAEGRPGKKRRMGRSHLDA